MPRNKSLTKSQQDNLRNSIARKAGQWIALADKCIQGDAELTGSQVRLITAFMGKVVPDLQSTQIEDITETTQDRASMEAAYNQAIESIKAQLRPEDITQVLATMDKDTRQALIDSIDAGKQ